MSRRAETFPRNAHTLTDRLVQDIHSELFDYYDRFPNQFRFYAPQVLDLICNAAASIVIFYDVRSS